MDHMDFDRILLTAKSDDSDRSLFDTKGEGDVRMMAMRTMSMNMTIKESPLSLQQVLNSAGSQQVYFGKHPLSLPKFFDLPEMLLSNSCTLRPKQRLFPLVE